MKIELLTSRASFRKANHAGDILNVPDDIPMKEAQRLMQDGQAIPCREEPVERAVLKVPEHASKRPRGKKRFRQEQR
jgi:hypothetical protein